MAKTQHARGAGPPGRPEGRDRAHGAAAPPDVHPRAAAAPDTGAHRAAPAAGDAEAPDTAEPSPQPHVVLGTTGPPPAYESEAVARAEAEARRSEPGAGPAPEPDTVRSDLLDDPDVRRSGPIRFGLVVLAAILVAALLLFLV